MRGIAAVQLTGLLVAVALSAGGLAFASGNGRGQQPQLTVTPNSGPVGTTVVIHGTGCVPAPGQTATVVFQNGEADRGTVGADGIYNIPLDDAGTFNITYSIPAEFAAGSLQGQGGGPITPGEYQFITKPPACVAKFIVTPSSLPTTGGPTGVRSNGPWPFFSIGLAILLVSSAIWIRALVIKHS